MSERWTMLPTNEAPTDREWTDAEWVRNQWWLTHQEWLHMSAEYARLRAKEATRAALVAKARALLAAKRQPNPNPDFDEMGWLTAKGIYSEVGYIDALRDVLRRLVEGEP